ncbi:MAG: septum formation protein Maf [Desulfomicrobium sp.]|nr:septum formation protein Maf [Desulfomicrobium sp.]
MNPGPSRQGPFRALLPLVLASASPRRQALLAGQGLGFEVVPSTLKEPAPEPGEAPAEYAARMARIKGQDIAARHPDKVIVSADTIVVQDSSILGKPKDAEDALDMLTALAGRWHEVMTGFCVLRHGDGVSLCRTVTTRVHMANNSRDMLQAYIGTGEPMDKAGAYGIQGIGAFLVDEVQGSYTNVVGLPLRSVLDFLLEIGAIGVANAR